ncbi:MAG: excinuclease ABC subunit UvrB [Paludibacteraceae bacterium]|nr:excinuclease ABC subunit UvrB [Paludibacteraceae bacterium]
MQFEISSSYQPTGDQPEAIKQLTENLKKGISHQTLLGVTGSGKTFTIANVIKNIQTPTLVLSHNKTLAAQLYSELKTFFPNNAVEYFVSYYDYYQPEAYIPQTDTYIEKDLAINDEIEKLRLSATSALLSGRKDVIVVSSVSCLYGIGNPADYFENRITLAVGKNIAQEVFLRRLTDNLYVRNDLDLNRGYFRVKGDTVDIFLAYADYVLRVIFWDNEIEAITAIDPLNGTIIERFQEFSIYPANIFVPTKDRIQNAIYKIQDDLMERIDFFKEIGKNYEAKRIEERVNYDLEMIRELGYCSGIENYSRYFDGRKAGSRPFCLLDYFPEDFLTIIDESHVTIPQIHAMFGGDKARKKNLIDYGFRLPAAADNRPLKFNEFDNLVKRAIYVSATPANYELERSNGVIAEQVVRPTGLLDPIIEVRPSLNQIDDLLEEITQRAEKDERVLITTLTKRMAEELTKYLQKNGIRCTYIHSEVETLDRVQIMEDLRNGLFDVLIGVNLLREGLDLPQVSLVAILDADKEGFLRSHCSLTQTVGRAARHVNGKAIMYASKITNSMRLTIDETNRRREKQLSYNIKHNITPQSAQKNATSAFPQRKAEKDVVLQKKEENLLISAKEIIQNNASLKDLEAAITQTKKKMQEAAKKLEFIEAAQYRDLLKKLEDEKKKILQ